jgi:PPOX class probable F420-dependent enzyme
MAHAAQDIDHAKYFSLRSFKKDGKAVDTPVWFAKLGEQYVVFTDGTSYKVKRIRRNPRVEIARCDAVGKVLGPWHAASCRILESEPERVAGAYKALNAKYGLLMRIGTVFASVVGRVGRRKILEISLDSAESAVN